MPREDRDRHGLENDWIGRSASNAAPSARRCSIADSGWVADPRHYRQDPGARAVTSVGTPSKATFERLEVAALYPAARHSWRPPAWAQSATV